MMSGLDSRLNHMARQVKPRVQLTLALQAVQDYRISVQSAPDRIVDLSTVTTVSPASGQRRKAPCRSMQPSPLPV
jgi:hypothetical protein